MNFERLALFLMMLISSEYLYGDYRYTSDSGWMININGYYEFYGEYFYDRRDDMFHISNFPEYIKIERSEQITGVSKYMAIEPLHDREPNHYVEFNINSSYKNNYFTFFKFYFNSSDDYDKYYNYAPARLKQGHFRLNKAPWNIYMFFREKPEPFDDPLEIFKPGREETYLRNNPDPIRVFEWDGNECQGVQIVYQQGIHKIKLITVDGLSKWYYVYWPKFSSYYNDIWCAGARYNITLAQNLIFGASYLMKSWYSASSEWEDHWSIFAIDGKYSFNEFVELRAELANSIANYDEYSSRPLEKGEAYKIEITGKDSGTDSKVTLSFRNIDERFPTGLTLYVANNIGYSIKAELNPFSQMYLMFYYDLQHKKDRTDENKQEYRSEFQIEWIENILTTRFLYQKILLHNERFIWWLQHTYENYIEYRPGIEINPLRKLRLNLWGDYIFYEQPHYEDYQPDIQKGFWIEFIYSFTKKININVGYKLIKNKIVWNLDEHLYRLEEYEQLRERRPMPGDEFDPNYGDSYGYYISEEDDIYYEGDNLIHHIFWSKIECQIYKNSRVEFSINWSKYNGEYSYWDRRLSLKVSTSF